MYVSSAFQHQLSQWDPRKHRRDFVFYLPEVKVIMVICSETKLPSVLISLTHYLYTGSQKRQRFDDDGAAAEAPLGCFGRRETQASTVGRV
jgi:hypothetical protein